MNSSAVTAPAVAPAAAPHQQQLPISSVARAPKPQQLHISSPGRESLGQKLDEPMGEWWCQQFHTAACLSAVLKNRQQLVCASFSPTLTPARADDTLSVPAPIQATQILCTLQHVPVSKSVVDSVWPASPSLKLADCSEVQTHAGCLSAAVLPHCQGHSHLAGCVCSFRSCSFSGGTHGAQVSKHCVQTMNWLCLQLLGPRPSQRAAATSCRCCCKTACQSIPPAISLAPGETMLPWWRTVAPCLMRSTQVMQNACWWAGTMGRRLLGMMRH